MGLKVLSLFDGISCGMVALKRAGIEVDRYVAYEIDKYAIKVSMDNHPEIEHRGDVCLADFSEFEGFDLVIGGSPCTYWSIAQKNNRETEASGLGYDLFMQFSRAIKESKCKWFLYENNHSIDKKIKAAITQELRVEHIMINSSLVSAQNRKRCYWTNIPNIEQPKDIGIMLKEILEDNECCNERSYPIRLESLNTCVDGKCRTIKANYYKQGMANFITNGGHSATCVAMPIRIDNNKNTPQSGRVYSIIGKSVTINANGGGAVAKTGLYKINLPDGDYIIRKLTVNECCRLQTLPDNYCKSVSNSQAYKGIGNGWTVDVIVHILKNIKGAI